MKLCLTGCGDVGYYIALAARLNPHITLIGCADPNSRRRDLFRQKFKIKHCYTDQREMLAEEKPDAVYIAVPHSLHKPLFLQAAAGGIAVLGEKPLAENVTSARMIIDEADKLHAKIAINYQWRYDPACVALIQGCRRGLIGKIRYMRIHVPWFRTNEYFTRSAWHASLQKSGGGTLLTQASHALDIALLSAGLSGQSENTPIQNNIAIQYSNSYIYNEQFIDIEVEDLAFGMLEYENGIKIQVCSSMVSYPERQAIIEIQGSEGAAVFRGPGHSKVKWYGPDKKHITLTSLQVLPPWCHLTARIIGQFYSLYSSLEDFRRWVTGGAPHRCTARDGMPVLKAVESLYEAAYSNKRKR